MALSNNNNSKVIRKNKKIHKDNIYLISKIYTYNNNNSWNGRGARLSENVRVKIADMGNACWLNHHFASLI
jgi:hypothetical protein